MKKETHDNQCPESRTETKTQKSLKSCPNNNLSSIQFDDFGFPVKESHEPNDN